MSVLFESYVPTSPNSYRLFDGSTWAAQSFTTTDAYTIRSVKLKLISALGDSDTLTVSIYTTDDNKRPTAGSSALTSGTFDASVVPTTPYAWYEIEFTSGYLLSAATTYAIVCRMSSPDDMGWQSQMPGGYTDGLHSQTTDSGSTWTSPRDDDCLFECWGTSGIINEQKYNKALVAIGNNEVWYESTLGTMEELTDANGHIETGDALTACEALQKVFIANGSNLKIADFVNAKITTTDIKPSDKVVPIKGTVLTGVTTAASMVVDFITASDSTCTVYGYRTTLIEFASGESVTGTVTTTDDVIFTTSAAEVAPPHWYSWTAYGADTTTYGTMPSQATLVCLYRGRLVLAGDSTYPHQWYMSRVINPWDWDYDVNDPLSPIRGGSADAGEIGDIIKTLISYKDDYLIFGCANSIWIMRGDPTFGGSIDLLTDKTGMYGSRAWCFDDTNTLYFFGKNGLYNVPVGAGIQPPENISQAALPNWIKDWDLDESDHRIVLSFDPIRRGILISKTAMNDGTNSNYYYDLKIGGFYPESYPTACGIFSAHYYDSTDNTYKKHLFGSNDGYIRYFLDSAKDDTAAAATAISSYLVYPIIQMSDEDDKEGKLISLTFVVGGGASTGLFGDSDGFAYSLYRGDDAETVLEDIKDGTATTAWVDATLYTVGTLVKYLNIDYICIVEHTSSSGGATHQEPDTNTTDWSTTAFTTGTFSTTGRQNRIRTRVRGRWLGLKLSNSTITETWAINLISGEMRPAGRIK